MIDPVAFREALMSALRKLPGLDGPDRVGSHGGDVTVDLLKRYATFAPCLRVAVQGFGKLERYSSGEWRMPLRIAVLAFTKDAASEGVGRTPRDQSCAALAASVALLTGGKTNRWGLSGVRAPENVEGRNEFSATIDEMGVAAWQVTWAQDVLIGASFDDAIAPLSQLWINGEPFVDGADPLLDHPQGPVLGDPIAPERPFNPLEML